MTLLLMYPMCCENGRPDGVCDACIEFSNAVMSIYVDGEEDE